jgi:mannose-6-phosphate isomerase
VPEFHSLLGVFEHGGYAGLYRHVMRLPQDEVDVILGPLVARIRREGDTGRLERSSADYWAVQAAAGTGAGPYDRGIFSIYFFNLVQLRSGQAIFQDAGIPHAYLQGRNLEVMANSDNVLRGGLTPKYVDVPELLRTVKFEGICPKVIEGTHRDNLFEAFYPSPTEDFELSRIHLGSDEPYVSVTQSTEILLIMDGTVDLDSGHRQLSLSKGQSAVAFGGSTYRIAPGSAEAVIFRVALPCQA